MLQIYRLAILFPSTTVLSGKGSLVPFPLLPSLDGNRATTTITTVEGIRRIELAIFLEAFTANDGRFIDPDTRFSPCPRFELTELDVAITLPRFGLL
jgi:hypothetical protein